MSNMWTELRGSYVTHPKFYKLAEILEIPVAYARGLISSVWGWAADYGKDGCIDSLSYKMFLNMTGYEGKKNAIEAMVFCGLLDKKNNSLIIHDWDDYNRIDMLNRNAERQKRYREKAKKTNTLKNSNVTRNVTRNDTVTPALQQSNTPHIQLQSQLHKQSHTQLHCNNVSNINTNNNMLTHISGEQVAACEKKPVEKTKRERKKREPNPQLEANLKTVLDYYLTKFPERIAQTEDYAARGMIIGRLKHYTPEQLCRAIDGNLNSTHHALNGWDSLYIIFKNAAQVDMFLDREANPHHGNVALSRSTQSSLTSSALFLAAGKKEEKNVFTGKLLPKGNDDDRSRPTRI